MSWVGKWANLHWGGKGGSICKFHLIILALPEGSVKTGKRRGSQFMGALIYNLCNLDVSLILFLIISLFLSLLLIRSVPWGKEALVLVVKEDAENCGTGECRGPRSYISSASFCLLLESPDSLLCLSPTHRISRGFAYLASVGSGRRDRGYSIFLSSWTRYPIKEAFLWISNRQTGSLKENKWPSGPQTAACPISVLPDLRNYSLFSFLPPKPCPKELMW